MAAGISQDSYETQSLNIRGNYNYASGRSQLVGYIATQNLLITVKNIDSKGTKVSALIDSLAKINGLEIQSVNFDILDKTSLQKLARERAFADAKLKAQDYAEFSGLKVGRVVTIGDYV